MMRPAGTLARAVSAMLLLFACASALAQGAAPANPGVPSAKTLALNDAQFVSQSVPASMVPGGVYNVSVTMKNAGSATWSSAAKYLLGSQNSENNLRWGGNRAALGAPVQPGSQGTFRFQVTAPAMSGMYAFQWGMVQEGVAWFGPLTPNVGVTVGGATPRNDAQVTAQSAPAQMTSGKSYNVSVTLKNIGTTTWKSADAYALGAENPHDNRLWNTSGRAALGATVAPGQQYTFSFPVIAPVAGSYSMQWRMLREGDGWFGGTSNSPVTVTAGAQAPTLTVTRTPSPMIAGQPFTLSWTSTDATSLARTCSAIAPGYTVNDAPAMSGTNTGAASSAWVGHPSTCNWKASGPGGAVQYTEWMSTDAAGGEIVTYIHTDGLGSPVARSDAAGNIISRTRYEPYGGIAGGVTPTIGFTGHVNDADTGLVYMQHRYYDPVAGRFLSIDPVTTDANTGSSFNRYVYANNSPYKYIDPDGRQSVGSMPTTSRIGYIDMGIRAWYGELMKYGQAALGVVTLGIGGPEAAMGKQAIVVTESSLRAALKGSEMKTAQESISLPMVKEYVKRAEAGEIAPAISVDGKVIVDGNHRYVAGEIAGKPAAIKEGTAAPSQAARAKPIEEIKISEKDFRDSR